MMSMAHELSRARVEGEESPLSLNAGMGQVQATHCLTWYLPHALRMMNGAPLFFSTLFKAVHAFNRHAEKTNFLGIVLPELAPGTFGLQGLGNAITVVGSQKSLEKLLEDSRFSGHLKRQIEEGPGIEEWQIVEGAEAVALLRDRAGEKTTSSYMGRKLRRIERKLAEETRSDRKEALLHHQKIFERKAVRLEQKSDMFPVVLGFVQVNDVKLNFRLMQGDFPVKPNPGILVSTWGLSYPTAPLYFTLNKADMSDKDIKKRRLRWGQAVSENQMV